MSDDCPEYHRAVADYMDLRQVHPEIASALHSAEGPVSVFAKLAVSGESAQQQAGALVERVAQETGITPQFNFRTLDRVLHVSAPGSFIRELLKQSEVIGASPVPAGTDAMIHPINVRPVDETAIDRPVHPRAPKR